MQPVARYGGSDDRSMAADNTSAFNCRYAVAPGPKRWSVHAYGEAIDVNTVENPYLEGGRVLPPAGRAFTDRSRYRRGHGGRGRRARAGVRVSRLALGRPLDRLARLAALLQDRRVSGFTSSSRSTRARCGEEPGPDERRAAIVIAPPATTAGTAPSERRGRARLERPELVRRADEHALDGVDAAAQRVRRRERDGGRADVHREHVDESADRERGAETTNQRDRPKTTMLAPKVPTTRSSVRPAWPPSGLRASRIPAIERADRDRAPQHAETERPGVQDRLREERQQRDGAAEEHGEEVERDRAEDDRRRADQADPAEQALEAGRLGPDPLLDLGVASCAGAAATR